MKNTLKKLVALSMTFVMTLCAMPLSVLTTNAASYPTVSLNVPYYRQQGVGLCSFAAFSMAEAYAAGYGANNETVYQAIRKAHAPDGKGGYIADPFISPALLDGKKYKTVSTSFETIYSYLKKNTPVVIYRGGDQPHWAIIYGYNGSSTSLEKSGFLVLNDARTDNLNFVWKQTLTEFLAGSTTTSLKYCAVRVNGVLPTANGPTDGELMYSSNTDSNYTSVYTKDISDNDATIYTYLKEATKIKACGFYIGTDENNLKKITKSLSGTSDGAGTVEYIFYKMSKWYGTLEPGTKYYYRFWYTDSNGNEIKSPVNWFITTGTASKTVTSISIKTLPDKTDYHPFEYIYLDGLVLTVHYSDGSSEDITDGYFFSPDKITMGGLWDITLTYEEVSTSFQIDAGSDEYLEQFYESPCISLSDFEPVAGASVTINWQDCFSIMPELYKEDSDDYGYEIIYTINEEEEKSILSPDSEEFEFTFQSAGTYTFTVRSYLGMSSQYSDTVIFDIEEENPFSIQTVNQNENVFTVFWNEYYEDASYEVNVYCNYEPFAEAVVSDLTYYFTSERLGTYIITVTASTPDGKNATDTYTFLVSQGDGPAVDGGEYEIKVADATAMAGESIDIPVEIAHNPGIAGLRLFITYPEELELIGIEDNGLFSSAVSHSNKFGSPFVISWFSSSGNDEYNTGTYVTLRFKIKEETEDGTYYIGITQEEGDAVTSAGEAYCFITGNGRLTVVNHIPGDVNDDTAVNMIDIVLLQQYLNNWEVNINETNSDVTGDSKINMMDIVLLQQYLNNWDVTLK